MNKISLFAVMALLATPCSAEDTLPISTNSDSTKVIAPNPGPYFFLLDAQDLNTIAAGLNETVKKLADPVFNKMTSQIQKQSDVINAAKAK